LKLLRTCVSGFFDAVLLVVRTVDEFDPEGTQAGRVG